ncbi:hypothetical protein B0H14DRAFT_2630638 [Mycena olivaceomarginata]|nr:hypothetical protein B0H14DRAFT_2630638 [Mycena olivaceomarginata]
MKASENVLIEEPYPWCGRGRLHWEAVKRTELELPSGELPGPANSSQVLQGRITSIQDVVNEGVLPKAAAIGQAIAADPLIQLLQHGCNYACIESCLLAPPSTLHMEGMLGELNSALRDLKRHRSPSPSTPPPRLPPLLLSLSHQPHLPSLPALPLFPHLLLSGVTLAPTPAAIPAGLAFVHAAALAPLPAGICCCAMYIVVSSISSTLWELGGEVDSMKICRNLVHYAYEHDVIFSGVQGPLALGVVRGTEAGIGEIGAFLKAFQEVKHFLNAQLVFGKIHTWPTSEINNKLLEEEKSTDTYLGKRYCSLRQESTVGTCPRGQVN